MATAPTAILQLWVSATGILISGFISVAAIFGDRMRAGVLKPQLRIALANSAGERETIDLPSGSAPFASEFRTPNPVDVRYYRLHVTNRAVYPAARDVEVLLIQFDKRGVDGQADTIFKGALPLRWQYHDLYGRTRTIGRTTEAAVDLLLVSQDAMRLTPIQSPINLGQEMLGEQHFWITVVARGIEGDSPAMRLRIDWNGEWSQGDAEMARNLKIASG